MPEAVHEAALDLTDRPIVTIDSASTRDMDDALHAIENPDGTWEVGIHVTDAAALVQPGSPSIWRRGAVARASTSRPVSSPCCRPSCPRAASV